MPVICTSGRDVWMSTITAICCVAMKSQVMGWRSLCPATGQVEQKRIAGFSTDLTEALAHIRVMDRRRTRYYYDRSVLDSFGGELLAVPFDTRRIPDRSRPHLLQPTVRPVDRAVQVAARHVAGWDGHRVGVPLAGNSAGRQALLDNPQLLSGVPSPSSLGTGPDGPPVQSNSMVDLAEQ